MKRFTAILFIISLLPKLGFAINVCVPVGASQEQLETFNGIELALKEHRISYTRTFNCTDVSISLSNNATLKLSHFLPSPQEEVRQITELLSAQNIALIYNEKYNQLADMLLEELSSNNLQPVLIYSYPDEKKNFLDLLKTLIELKEQQHQEIDGVIFIGSYRKAILIMPFFRIFRPFPQVVATWRIYDPLMFAYRSFMKTTEYYEWFPSWLPLLPIREFVLKYLTQYKSLPTRFAALGYDMGTIAASVERQENIAFTVTGITQLNQDYIPERSYYLVRLRDLPRLAPPHALR